MLNASLAIQLSYDWLRKHPDKVNNELLYNLNNDDFGLTLHNDVVDGILNCFWPGRCQILTLGNKR